MKDLRYHLYSMTDNLIFSSSWNAHSFNYLWYTSFVWDSGGSGGECLGRVCVCVGGGGGGEGGLCLYFPQALRNHCLVEGFEVGTGLVSLWILMLRTIVFVVFVIVNVVIENLIEIKILTVLFSHYEVEEKWGKDELFRPLYATRS